MAGWQKGYQYNVAPPCSERHGDPGACDQRSGRQLLGRAAATDVKDRKGKELWRFWTDARIGRAAWQADTWPGESWKHGGRSIWNAGAYDPETNLTFWGTGNPNPGWNGDPRAPGDNSVFRSVIALDADTGKLKWTPVHSGR